MRTWLAPLFAFAQAPAPSAEELTLESAIAMRNNHEVRNAPLERALGEE